MLSNLTIEFRDFGLLFIKLDLQKICIAKLTKFLSLQLVIKPGQFIHPAFSYGQIRPDRCQIFTQKGRLHLSPCLPFILFLLQGFKCWYLSSLKKFNKVSKKHNSVCNLGKDMTVKHNYNGYIILHYISIRNVRHLGADLLSSRVLELEQSPSTVTREVICCFQEYW